MLENCGEEDRERGEWALKTDILVLHIYIVIQYVFERMNECVANWHDIYVHASWIDQCYMNSA